MTTYVLDTSVLLADPRALHRFAEHDVVIPVVVVQELEGKRDDPELGWFAREALRGLERLRTAHGSLTVPLPANEEGGTVRVELNHSDRSALPEALRGDTNDHRILAVARNLAAEGHRVAVVSKDLPLRLFASTIGLEAQHYRNEQTVDSGWTGMVELDVDATVVDALHQEGTVDLDAARDLPVNTGAVVRCGSQSALARVNEGKQLQVVRGDRAAFGLVPRSAEQRIALDLLADDSVGIVSLGGPAGTGKSVLAIAAGLEAVVERRTHKRVMVFRPLHVVGEQQLGFLPGDVDEKMAPLAAAVDDAIAALGDPAKEAVAMLRCLEVAPLTHIRGRTLTDTWVIVDEAQNLERGVLLTALSRLGHGSKVVLTHDVAQRDNLRVGRHDGVVAVIEKLKGHPLFGHVTLTRSERSPVAALVTRLLDE